MLMDGPIRRLRAPRRRYTKPRHVRLPIEEQQTVKGGGAGRVPGPGGAAAPGAAGRGGAAEGCALGPRALRYICRTYRRPSSPGPLFAAPSPSHPPRRRSCGRADWLRGKREARTMAPSPR